jgi:hypothetical protein
MKVAIYREAAVIPKGPSSSGALYLLFRVLKECLT